MSVYFQVYIWGCPIHKGAPPDLEGKKSKTAPHRPEKIPNRSCTPTVWYLMAFAQPFLKIYTVSGRRRPSTDLQKQTQKQTYWNQNWTHPKLGTNQNEIDSISNRIRINMKSNRIHTLHHMLRVSSETELRFIKLSLAGGAPCRCQASFKP